MKEISSILLHARKAKNLTQLQAAEKVGVSRQAISKWESGAAMPSTENLLALSRLYEIPLDAFVKDMCQEGEATATADVGSPEQPTAKRTPKRHVAKWICTACIVALFTALGFALGSEWGEHESQIVDMGDLPAESWNDANVEEFPVELP